MRQMVLGFLYELSIRPGCLSMHYHITCRFCSKILCLRKDTPLIFSDSQMYYYVACGITVGLSWSGNLLSFFIFISELVCHARSKRYWSRVRRLSSLSFEVSEFPFSGGAKCVCVCVRNNEECFLEGCCVIVLR